MLIFFIICIEHGNHNCVPWYHHIIITLPHCIGRVRSQYYDIKILVVSKIQRVSQHSCTKFNQYTITILYKDWFHVCFYYQLFSQVHSSSSFSEPHLFFHLPSSLSDFLNPFIHFQSFFAFWSAGLRSVCMKSLHAEKESVPCYQFQQGKAEIWESHFLSCLPLSLNSG